MSVIATAPTQERLSPRERLEVLCDPGSVQVMRGEEPFVAAALAAVKHWKYTPAQYKGQPIAVYRIIQIPFKLTA